MPAFTSIFSFLLLPLPRHLLNEELSWRLRCSASLQSAPRILAQSLSPAPFLGGVHRRGALPLTQPKPRPRVAAYVSPPPHPQSSATGCVGWCFPRRPAALGPARGACSCGLPPTPSAPDAWPQPQRRSSSFSHPTCKYYRTPTPAPLSLRFPVVVCLLC